jgi:hypothetical protein
MLGEQIYEHKGKIIGQRILDVSEEAGLPKIETTFSATAKLKGTIDITDIGSYWSIVKPGGVLYGEGQGVYTTKDGEMATWTGQGIGRFTAPGGVSFRGSLFFRTNSTGKLSFLNNLVAVFEYEVDEQGNTTAKAWEWK